MSQFSVKGDKESKMRFAFRIYDMDNDGYISNGELFQVSVLNIHTYIKNLKSLFKKKSKHVFDAATIVVARFSRVILWSVGYGYKFCVFG